MDHLRRPILYPPPGHPHHFPAPSIVASSSDPTPRQRRRPRYRSARSGAANPSFMQGFLDDLMNPSTVFAEDPETEQPAASEFVADSIAGGFDLNRPVDAEASDQYVQPDNGPNNFADGPQSATSATDAFAAEEAGEEVCSQPVVPYVGMTFESIEQAQIVYNDYAWKMGFGTHIGNTKYSQAKNAPKNTILSRVFECVHKGKLASEKPVAGSKTSTAAMDEDLEVDMSAYAGQKSKSKQAGAHKDAPDMRQRSKLLRHDCKAKMLVGRREGGWAVTVFIEEHTHPFVQQIGRRRYYRSHRKVPEEDFQFLQTLHEQNITTAKIMGCLGSVHGGDPRCLGYVKKDVANIRGMLREEMTVRDMSMTMEYFKQRQALCPSFYYASQVDSNNAVRALFWVDGRTRSLYSKYKDCVFFDTTFCTNRYNMPFAPIVGINNHTHTIVLGCALLSDEKVETFKWVFEKWMEAMGGEHPQHIMTDQCSKIAAAIKEVFKDSIHRACVFHVFRLAKTKLGPKMKEGHPFAEAFYATIYGTDTVEEFEICWQQMIQNFALMENKHLQNMWNARAAWAPVYFRKCFFPFTSTTGRSEGLNSYFKSLITPSDSVWTFVQQYELCQNLMLDREDNSGFVMEATTAALWGSYPIEKQALLFYTREVFERFRKMVVASTKFFPLRGEEDALCYDLVPNPGIDMKTYRVRVVVDDGLYSCGCNTFEMCGLICAHIIRVMVHLNVQVIPDRYLLRRWSAAATTPSPDPGTDGIRFSVPPTNTLRYNALCRKMNDLASAACFGDATYTMVSEVIADTNKRVAALTRELVEAAKQPQQDTGANTAHMNEAEEQRTQANQAQVGQGVENKDDGPAILKNPARVKPAGRPKLKEQRRKPLIELREEAAAKRRKKATEPKKQKVSRQPRQKRTKKCPFCSEEGHVVQDCKYYKAKVERDAELAAGAELRL